MATGTTLPISLLTIVLLLVPGLVSLELYFRRTSKQDRTTRTKRIVYSIFLSLASLGTLYLLSPLYFDWVSKSVRSLGAVLNVASRSELLGLALFSTAVLYALHFVLTLVLGHTLGFVEDEFWNPDRVLDRRPPWEYAFDEAKSEEVEVTLDDGTIIRGRFNDAAWDKESHDLYIEEPEEVQYKDGIEIGEPTDLGRSLLLKQSAIGFVAFTKEDPNSEPPSEIEEEEYSSNIDEQLDEMLHGELQQVSLDEWGNETSKAEERDDLPE